ncbi:hypothetical protein ACFQ6B_38245 [Streptomyces wedmorensis]|uniref:Uncharacterized protein n=1 Tax=Streptomyces wedmorensis TaxID=43759 RepID=A0ABW6J5P1_STRWE
MDSPEDNGDAAALEELQGFLEVGGLSAVVEGEVPCVASDVGVVPDQGEGPDDAASAAQAVTEIVEPSAEPAAGTDERFA